MSGDGFDSDGLPVGHDGVGLDYLRPTQEPFVDPSFPDSTYDADPEFGRRGDSEAGDDPDEGTGLGTDLGP